MDRCSLRQGRIPQPVCLLALMLFVLSNAFESWCICRQTISHFRAALFFLLLLFSFPSPTAAFDSQLHNIEAKMYVCICVCVIKVVVVHLFCTIILSEVTSVVVLTGLFLIWTLCEFMINLRVAEWPNQPAAAGALIVLSWWCCFLYPSACVYSSPGPYKTVLLDFALCKCVHCPHTPTYPLCIYAIYWPSTLCD